MYKVKYLVTLSSIISMASLPVDAHTGVNTVNGLLDGLVHPLIGFDHLLVMIAMGFLAVKQGGHSLWLIPMTFLAFMMVGAELQQLGFFLDTADVWVTLTVLASGWIVWRNDRLSSVFAVLTSAIFAVFHGFVHTEALIDSTHLVPYALGFLTTTSVLILVGIMLSLLAKSKMQIMRAVFSVVCAVVGLTLLVHF